ncbi:helix-turn-helix transcriptional regulator [uncultured Shewanella sp.]|uniref:helix-turn-helix transcriptional regulator n=1 Tax=uncultured Shewanella sp. TaxID=173975 RepID=UPI00262849DC|nr:helix-turn-helix transcriptional regulator [uncultured Shewanella sp.]
MLSFMEWIIFYFSYQKKDKLKVASKPVVNRYDYCRKVAISDDKYKSFSCKMLSKVDDNERDKLIFRTFIHEPKILQVVSGASEELYANVYLLNGVGNQISKESILETVTLNMPDNAGVHQARSFAKQRSVVKLTALGFNTQDIAKALCLTPRGVEYHLNNAKHILGANNKSNLVYLAAIQGWLNLN